MNSFEAAELASIRKELLFQNNEREKSAAELEIANEEKAKRVDELVIADAELIFQSDEKAKRAEGLVADALDIANKELFDENEEQAKRVVELVIAHQEKAKRIELQIKVNEELLFRNEEKVKRAAELVVANDDRSQLEALNIQKLHSFFMETLGIARDLSELRDPYTAGHGQHVGDLAKAIAEELGLDESCQTGLKITGYLHDIGKIIVPSEILSKPGKLTEEEFSLVKAHVQAGYDLLKNVNFPWNIARPLLEHHERLDGSGYPNHLTANQISLEGRILAVADVVEAMTVHRSYRAALGIDTALAEIENGRGTTFDEKVVDACLNLFRKKNFVFKRNTQDS